MIELRFGRMCCTGAVLTALVVAGCSWLPFAPRTLAACPGELRSTDATDSAVVTRYRMRVSADDFDFPLQVVAQSRADERIVIGFNPFGAKLFSVVQQGSVTRVDALPGAVLPVPPLNIVRDLHRVRFLSANPPPPGTTIVTADFGAVWVTETWSSDRIERREFSPTGTVVEFSSDTLARVDNPSCGYTTELETLSEEPIR